MVWYARGRVTRFSMGLGTYIPDYTVLYDNTSVSMVYEGIAPCLACADRTNTKYVLVRVYTMLLLVSAPP